MDKYEFNIKVDQIKKLASRKEYKEAAQIASSMNWQKVKDWQTLATVINVQEAAGDLLEARDMAILAYNRNLGGRKLVYKLTELLIKLEDFENAEELYDEYERMAQHDVNRFILYYELRKAQKASDNELVEILEDYREHEIDEKYMYELAKLYFNTGRKDECIKICDDLVLWFQDGIYVENAIKLKKEYGVALTKTQKSILENARKRKADKELDREEQFKKQQELVRIQHDDVEEELRRDELGEEEETGGIKGFFKKAFSGFQSDRDDEDYDNEEYDESQDSDNEEFVISVDNEKNTDNKADIEYINNAQNKAKQKLDKDTAPEADNLNKASISLRELIESAKKQVEDNCEQVSRGIDIAAKAAAKNVEPETLNVPQKDSQSDINKDIVNNLNRFMQEDEKAVESLRPHPIITDDEEINSQNEQIEGQLSLADWIETVREEKYGHQDTKEFSRVELERMLDEKNEKSEAYERLIARQKEKAEAEGTRFDEAKARYDANVTMMVNAAKTDLAIRTGKATARLEVEADRIRQAKQQNMRNEPYDELAEKQAVMQAARSDDTDKASLRQQEYSSDENGIYHDTDKPGKFTKKNNMSESMDDLDEVIDDDKKLSPELAKIFRKYIEMPGLEKQLANLFEALEKEMQISTSEFGNIIISGNSSSDKTDLARTIIRAINQVFPDKQKKIAKTTGDSINHRGLTKAMHKLNGTALIVEGAGVIQPKRISEILDCMKQHTDRMIVIFEDSDAEMNVLINFNPELTRTFNHRITLKQYTVNELVEMARKYARKRQFEVDDDALLELYLKIDKLHTMNDNIKLDDIKEVINRAIENSERRASRKIFGGLKKKRSDSGSITFLSEADFKD